MNASTFRIENRWFEDDNTSRKGRSEKKAVANRWNASLRHLFNNNYICRHWGYKEREIAMLTNNVSINCMNEREKSKREFLKLTF